MGPPGSGKTCAIKSFLLDRFKQSQELNQPFYPNYTTTITEEIDSFSDLIPRKFISNKLNITNARATMKWLSEKYRIPKNVVIIYDDIDNSVEGRGRGGGMGATKGKFHKLLEELVMQGSRHLKADIIITSQHRTLMEPKTRECFSYYMFIIRRSDVPINSVAAAKFIKNVAMVCDIDVESFQQCLQNIFLTETGDFRILFMYDRVGACYYWKKFTPPAETSIIKDYLNNIKNIPSCFIKSSGAAAGAANVPDNEGQNPEICEESSSLEHELSVASMMEEIQKMNPGVWKILQRTKNFEIIKREHLKMKAVLKFRNKLNIFYILYNAVFIFAEYIDRHFKLGQCRGLCGYRERMTESEKNSERELITAVVEAHVPAIGRASPILDLTLHTLTIIVTSRLNYQMEAVLTQTLGDIHKYQSCPIRTNQTATAQ